MRNMSSVYSLRGLIMNSHEQSASEVSIASNCFHRPRSSISQPGISRPADQRRRLHRRASSGFTVRRGAPRSSRKTMTAADKGGSGHQPWSTRKYPFKQSSPLAKQQTGKADLEADDARSRCAARARVLGASKVAVAQAPRVTKPARQPWGSRRPDTVAQGPHLHRWFVNNRA